MGRGKGVRAASRSSIGISFQYRSARCREKLKLAPTEANKKYAERLKATIEHEIALGTFDYAKHFPNSPRALRLSRSPGQLVTVADALRSWIDGKQGEVEPETWSEYEKDIRKHLIPKFGERRLTEFRRDEVKTWAKESPLSRKRLNNILIPLRSMLDDVVDSNLLPSNPLARFKIKKLRTVKDEVIDPFSQAEIAAILDACGPAEANMVQFWVWVGPRIGELVALRWPDIDWQLGTIRIARAVREGRTKATKTESGTREVKLLAPAMEALERQKAVSYMAGDHIWLNPRTGAAWTGDGPIRKTFWVYVLKKAKVRYRYPNQLRHTFASWMLSAGENPLWVAKQMGHKDWSQIVKTYGKWIPDVDPLAGERAVGAIYGPIRARSAGNVS